MYIDKVLFVLVVMMTLICGYAAFARDLGQWDQSSYISLWYRSLKMPDTPQMSCCGEADAYYADSFEVGPNGEYVAIITDERNIPYRKPREVGTKIIVPNYKIKYDQGNPTGHGIVFLAPHDDHVYCYLPPGGV